MEKLTLKQLDSSNLQQAAQCESEFLVTGRLRLRVESNQITYTTEELPDYTKRYDESDLDPSLYIGNPERIAYLAYLDDQLAGEIYIRKNWNRFAYIDSIAVNPSFRRKGVGRALIEQARHWARKLGLPGMMLETQDINLQACQFYQSCGFQLGGFDKFLYQGLMPGTQEVALYWYEIF